MNIRSTAPTTAASASQATGDNIEKGRQFRQAVLVWIVFFVLLVLLNGTIPFALGADLHAWTASSLKYILVSLLFYEGIFLGVPLVLIKGRATFRRPDFLLPLFLAAFGIALRYTFRPGVAVALAVLAYLHWRFDLSGYGIRSNGWKADLLAILLMGILGLVAIPLQGSLPGLSFSRAATAALQRLFANPASSVENFFYFGFLAERVSYKAGKWFTPLLIGLMYTAQEMSNPEYWYGGMSFGFVFAGVALWTAIYLWRRSAVVIWLGDGLYRFVMALF